VSVFASGPGASRFNAFLDNTEIFFAMMDALGVQAPSPAELVNEQVELYAIEDREPAKVG
jgi:hypothetical protein